MKLSTILRRLLSLAPMMLIVALVIFSVTYLIVNLPSLRSKKGFSEKWGSEPKFLWLGWLPMVVAAFFSSASPASLATPRIS